jgi:hypothetical protein
LELWLGLAWNIVTQIAKQLINSEAVVSVGVPVQLTHLHQLSPVSQRYFCAPGVATPRRAELSQAMCRCSTLRGTLFMEIVPIDVSCAVSYISHTNFTLFNLSILLVKCPFGIHTKVVLRGYSNVRFLYTTTHLTATLELNK